MARKHQQLIINYLYSVFELDNLSE